MPESADQAEADAPMAEVPAVSKTVLVAFFDELAKTEGFVEIAPKLKALVLDQGVFAEPAIRAAMFSDIP